MPNATEDDRAQEFLSGKLSHVDVAAIEKELRNLWKQAAREGDVESGTGSVVRACALNLILFSDAENAESVCSDLLDEVEQGHPCRSILAIFRPTKQPRLDAWVSARCHLMGDSKQICSEQITVCCDGGQAQQLASVVRPLIVPDLPVFLWWRQADVNWSEFSAIHGCARRFILDSSLDPFNHQLILDAARIIAENQSCLYVSDINWRRLYAWCRATADCFDGFPMALESLKKIRQLTVNFAHSGDTGSAAAVSNQALLYSAWLAARLDWKPMSFEECGARFVTADGDNIAVDFRSSKAEAPFGDLEWVEATFEGQQSKLIVQRESTPEATFIVARNSQSDQKESTRVAQASTEAVLLGQELEVLLPDRVYEESTNMAAMLLGMRK